MVEWSITTVLKTVVLRGTGGSNPSLSATNAKNQQIAKQTLGFTLFDVKPSVLFTSNSIPTTYGLHTQRFVHFSV